MGRWRAVAASDRDPITQRPSAGRVMVNALDWLGRPGASAYHCFSAVGDGLSAKPELGACQMF